MCGEIRFQQFCRKCQVGRCRYLRDCGYLRLSNPSGDFSTLCREDRDRYQAANQCIFSHLCGLCGNEHTLIECPRREEHRAALLRGALGVRSALLAPATPAPTA